MGKPSPVSTLRSFLLRLGGGAARDVVDEQLLEQFAAQRSDAAFTALLQRHGPMVWAACRRVLGDGPDAEDAWQATFLVLARKASTLDGRRSLASWLHTVAHNVSVDLRIRDRRRHGHEQAAAPPAAVSSPTSDSAELKDVLDEELSRLPEKYRAPLVLCYLQGKSNEEAAHELGWPAGSMSRRLTRARELLKQKLVRRGAAWSAALFAAQFERTTASPPADMAQATIAAARAFAEGNLTPERSASPARLAEGALQAMSTKPGRILLMTAVVGGLLIAGAGLLAAGLLREPPREKEVPFTRSDLAPAPRWQFQSPLVLETMVPPPGARPFSAMAPVGFCWCAGRPVLAVVKGAKADDPICELWTEGKDGIWNKFRTLEHTRIASLPVAVGDFVGVFSSVGEDNRGSYNCALHFTAVPLGNARIESREIYPAPTNGRATISGASVWDNTIQVFILVEEKGQIGKNQVFLVRSRDQGKTWEQPLKVSDTTMHEDNSRLPVLQWAADGFGRFLFERDGSVTFLHTSDDGKNWINNPVQLADDEGPKTRRMPLSAARIGKEIALAYLAVDPEKDRTKGRYYLTRSADRKTWSKGTNFAEQPKMDDPAVFASMAVAGERVAFTFIATLGRWTSGEVESRMVLSEDGGRTWQRVPLERYYKGLALLSTLTASPAGDRLIYSSAVLADLKQDATSYLVVQEFAPKEPPASKLTAAQQKDVETLIGQLASEDFATREAATQKLSAYGAAAKKELVAARQAASDLEAKTRLQRILDRLFPAPLRIE
ncbi:MAG: sigma-70 family RNA polymerase sigma factor [Gemmataceae bacterium]